MFHTFQKRAQEAEIIDDFNLDEHEIKKTFRSIELVNIWLGGNQVFVNSLKRITTHKSFKNMQSLQLHDLGCGSGDGLRALANWCQKKGVKASFTGVDANPRVIHLAKAQSSKYANIQYLQADIFSDTYQPQDIDIACFNLCLHHFEKEEIHTLLQKCKQAGVKVILINDLHRHWLAYYLFGLVALLFFMPATPRKDGLLSIRKGFKKKDLEEMAQSLKANYYLAWRWAFRYQFILYLHD